MKKNEFIEEVKDLSRCAIQNSNNFLKLIDRDVSIDWNYDFETFDKNALGVYEHDSVHTGTISIGMNIIALWNFFKSETKDYPYTSEYKILQELILTNVYHEVGHGIIDYINDYLQNTDELDEIYDNNQQLFDDALDNEEDTVEEFAWDFYDNQPEDSKLGQIINLYHKLYNNINETLIIEDKIGGFNYGKRGDDFYTQEKNIVSELSNYNLKNKVVYCNCDNPLISNFYKFFKNNFHDLSLKGLYATYFDKNPKMFFFNGSQEISKPIDSGRFQDNAEIMKRCDIVITNPPFSNSMGSELIKMAKSFGKNVIMVGPNTIANQKEMFELIKNGQLNMGYTSINRFNMPDGTKKTAPTSWWTTMNTNKPIFKTGIKFNPSNYQKYDNYDAIDIKDYRQIPDDYYGYMGVSPKFLRVLNRNQFEIITKLRPIINGRVGFEKYIIQRKKL